MFGFYVAIIFSCLLCSLAVGAKTESKEKVYYKHTVATAGAEAEAALKDDIPIAMEGQSPVSESIKLNSAKVNLREQIVKKESKTIPRKGVLNKLNEKDDQNSTLTIDASSEKPVVEITNALPHITESHKQAVANATQPQTSSTLHLAPVREIVKEKQDTVNDATTKTVKKPKPKPEVTIGGKEADEPIPALPTVKSPLSTPRKIDYIVPIAITFTALPLLGVAFYVLYKRGRDYWDKRHYRRMDFLIDGMYNE